MFRFKDMAQIGFFDPFFFLYYEEVELQHRLAKAGRTVHYVPQAQVVHVEGAATGQFSKAKVEARPRLPGYLYQSRWYYLMKTQGRALALLGAILMIPAAVLNILHRGLQARASTLPRRFFYDHWRLGILPLLPGGSWR